MALHLYIKNTAAEFCYYLYISNFICQLYLNKSEKTKQNTNNHIHSICYMPGPVISALQTSLIHLQRNPGGPLTVHTVQMRRLRRRKVTCHTTKVTGSGFEPR